MQNQLCDTGSVQPRPGSPDPHVRWLALDRLRAAAVVFMIQGHTFSAVLGKDRMPAALAHWHEVLHGLTAPAFLLGAGLAFGVATYPRYAEHRRNSSVVQSRLRRYALLILLGYALQLPGGSLRSAWSADGRELELLCRVGPLQLIGVVLGLCQLGVLVTKSPRVHILLTIGLGGVMMCAATPMVHAGVSDWFGPFFAAYFEERGGSHFPLLPWAAFVLFGVGASGFLHDRAAYRRALPILVLGTLVTLVAYQIYQSAALHPAAGWLWRTSPSYLAFRLGLVVVVLGALHLKTSRAEESYTLAHWSSLLATHSLVAYVVHLWLLYGTCVFPGVAPLLGKSVGVAQAGAASALILVCTLAITRLWDLLEDKRFLMPWHKQAGLAVAALSILAR